MKRIFLWALLCALLIVLAGCQKPDTDSTPPGQESQTPSETAPTAGGPGHPGQRGW